MPCTLSLLAQIELPDHVASRDFFVDLGANLSSQSSKHVNIGASQLYFTSCTYCDKCWELEMWYASIKSTGCISQAPPTALQISYFRG